jgi:acetolactate synthase I/II/III large subunit
MQYALLRTRFGARTLVDALVANGVTTLFANPGTSEVHLVAALDANPVARAVLCLHENVATGAADGFARVSGCPAAVLLHLGPGLANGLSNLHNAMKARSPMIVLVGDHATGHQNFDTPLRSDIDRIAPFAAKETFRLKPGDDVVRLVRLAVETSKTPPEGPVVIVASADVMWSEAPITHLLDAEPPAGSTIPPDVLEAASAMCGQGERTALVLGGDALSKDGLFCAADIARATGCILFAETFNARHERGAGIPAVERIPYFPESAVGRLAPFQHVLLIGSRPPVAFFASPDRPSVLTRDGAQLLQAPATVRPRDFLTELARRLRIRSCNGINGSASRSVLDAPSGPLMPSAIWAVVNRLLPAGAIVSDEAGVTSVGADEAMRGAAPHSWLNVTGGSIGQGLPVATGAAVGRPDATVVALHGDGGALYTMQALWTQARKRLSVINTILRNDRYAILEYEMRRHGLPKLKANAADMFSLIDPGIEWVSLAQGLGVEALSVRTAEDFEAAFEDAITARAPRLIELRLPQRK